MNSEIVEVKIGVDFINDEDYISYEIEKAKKQNREIKNFVLKRKSLDSRQRNIFFLMRYELFYEAESTKTVPSDDYQDVSKTDKEAVIIGAGPAGYFAALQLIKDGIRPIIFDRGKDVRERRRDLRAIQQDGVVNPHSNYCFGEGGAGTYSDGKLYTRSYKRGKISDILQTLHDHGAPDDILYDAHPHIGSNKLPKIVTALRNTIESYGGKVHFNSWVVDIEIKNNEITSVLLENGDSYKCSQLILATGHSARDIFHLLHNKGVALEAKDYAIGMRIEHPQDLIDEMQYRHAPRHENLPAASYRLATEIDNKGVFSFCMCPGGLIVPAATAPGELVVNGMSLSRRDSPFSNSGFVTAVDNDDFKDFANDGIFAGLNYQKHLESLLWEYGDGSQKAPAQNVMDFIEGKTNTALHNTSYIPGLYSAPLHELLPVPIVDRIRQGLRYFAKRNKQYLTNEAQFIGIESRTSSPIRIPRDYTTGQHPHIKGLFPCGEGAGYAGGILSACMDGIFCAKKVDSYISN
jgi:uncharacterized FAD-dependent dehydrogenase